MSLSPFIALSDVERRTQLSNPTRWRREKEGRFPRRINLARCKPVYRLSEIEAWERDPEGWRPDGNGRGVTG